MRAVVQRVKSASVSVNGVTVSSIGSGMLVLLGAAFDDSEKDVCWLVDKVADLRIFSDSSGKMNLDVSQIDGAILVVSQFTLYGDCRKGKRPSYSLAATAETARKLYSLFLSTMEKKGIPVKNGVFGEMMQVELVNDGPVTLIIESP
jgi:D-tyrosyl-tRNA(Tyr) deacylase